MPPNDDIVFTSRSTLRIPHFPPSTSHSSFRFCFRNLASQFDQSCNSISQFIDSVKRGSKSSHFNHSFPQLWPPTLPFCSSKKVTQRENSSSRRASWNWGSVFVEKSPLICLASMSLIQSDMSSKSESEDSGRRRGMEDKSTGLVGKSSLLCSASLALARSDESSQSGGSENKELPQKGYSAARVDEERVLISEVLVRNKDGEELERKDLELEVFTALKASRPNSALTVREVQEDVHRIINSGYFYSCIPVAVDTRDGIRLIFQVEPNQEFQGLVCEGANVLPAKFLEEAFRDGYGKVVNLRHLDEVISSINSWYGERGLFGRVSAVDILSGGILSLQVSEAEVNNISIRFLDKKTGEPIPGNTRPETILRQLTTKKGQVYSMLQGKRDAETVLTMGIMEDVSIIPQPAADAGKVDILMNVVERPGGGFSAGGGLSCGSTGGAGLLSTLIGSLAYSHRNLFGRNQKLHVSLEKGQVDSTFRINYTDPWIEGDDKRTSRTIMVQNSRTPGTLVHGGSNLTIVRVTAGLEFNRPIRPTWSGTAGLYFQRAGAQNEKGEPILKDNIKCPLTASGNAVDNMLLAKLEGVYTGSGDHGSSMFVLSMEQGLPFLPEWLCFNRVNARARTSMEVGFAQLLLSLALWKESFLLTMELILDRAHLF
ncbi:outer envelope protein 80, chloroplastic isoform X2 [Cucumis melo]|uniref:Outer envelope protein 80, chloroplastic isoform X2 n=1 Tax=Cucumis melo TaxID=3656 RepID=A0A9I9D8J2_CUCME|nr:outer envelope protein 80, chloroplastic isoform X2 [Cucumis melo]